jgi:hypothetical protein
VAQSSQAEELLAADEGAVARRAGLASTRTAGIVDPPPWNVRRRSM